MNKLERALSSFLSPGQIAGQLAQVLAHASKRGRVSYSEVERIAKGSTEDVLLLASGWRLLLPVRTSKSAAWEDRVLVPEPGEIYEMPNVVRYLVENASHTGRWDAAHAIAQLFRVMGGKYRFDPTDSPALWTWDLIQNAEIERKIFFGIEIFMWFINT